MNVIPQPHTILVIATAPNVRMTVRLALEEAGYKVDEARAIEPLSPAQEHATSLAVVDLSSAQDKEMDVLLTWHSRHQDLPIIAIGGKSRSVNRLFVENPAGIARTFWKPFALSDLVAAVGDELRTTTKGSTPSDGTETGIVSALRRLPAKTRQLLHGDGGKPQGPGLAMVLLWLGFVFGCANQPTVPSARTHDIHIGEQVSPRDLYVNTGDEVRWHNLRTGPVTVGLLSHHHLDLVSCEKGFKRFGMVDDTATIPPKDYVSLCFSRPGTVQYNVWLNPGDPTGSMVPTAKIQVSAASPSWK